MVEFCNLGRGVYWHTKININNTPLRFGRFANGKCRQNGHLQSLIEVRISFNTTSSRRKGGTPLKTNMEPENHPFEKENHLIQTSFLGSMLVFAAICICDLMPQTWVGFQHQNTGNFPSGFHEV